MGILVLEGLKAYQIILLVCLILLVFYVAFFAYVLSHALDFRGNLTKISKSMGIILQEWASNLSNIYSVLKSADYSLPKEEFDILSPLDSFNFEKMKSDDLKSNISKLNRINSKLGAIVESSGISGCERYFEICADLEGNCRKCASLYNADVAAYNYWIAVPGCRFWFYLFRFKKEKFIN